MKGTHMKFYNVHSNMAQYACVPTPIVLFACSYTQLRAFEYSTELLIYIQKKYVITENRLINIVLNFLVFNISFSQSRNFLKRNLKGRMTKKNNKIQT